MPFVFIPDNSPEARKAEEEARKRCMEAFDPNDPPSWIELIAPECKELEISVLRPTGEATTEALKELSKTNTMVMINHATMSGTKGKTGCVAQAGNLLVSSGDTILCMTAWNLAFAEDDTIDVDYSAFSWMMLGSGVGIQFKDDILDMEGKASLTDIDFTARNNLRIADMLVSQAIDAYEERVFDDDTHIPSKDDTFSILTEELLRAYRDVSSNCEELLDMGIFMGRDTSGGAVDLIFSTCDGLTMWIPYNIFLGYDGFPTARPQTDLFPVFRAGNYSVDKTTAEICLDARTALISGTLSSEVDTHDENGVNFDDKSATLCRPWTTYHVTKNGVYVSKRNPLATSIPICVCGDLHPEGENL